MLLPIQPLSFDIARPADVVIVSGAPSARVLACWSGVPLGVVTVPATGGVVMARDVVSQVLAELREQISRELVRRALLHCGVGEGVRLDQHWDRVDSIPERARPTISVVICTRDRPDDLAACLKSLAELQPPPLEVVVIDNAPATDASRRLVLEQFPFCRYVLEERPGLDHARNRGIREARGEVIAFTDDDVVVEAGWTSVLQAAFAEDPTVGLVTGLIEPLEQETEAQVWFERYGGFGRGFTRRRFHLKRGHPLPSSMVGVGQLGAGANMAVRRVVFEETGLFDPALDVGTPTRGGGDHEMFFRLLRSGWACVYEPAAMVRHRHRRTMHELRGLLYSYGYATRCYLEREAIFFPTDRKAIRKLTRWWWKHWGLKRWLSASFCPDRFPPDLVMSEIRGFLDGRGGYRRSRASIVADESASPDQFKAGESGRGPLRNATTVLVDIENPLQDLDEGAQCESLDVIVRWRGTMVGRVRIPTFGAVVRRSQLADCLSGQLTLRILGLGWETPLLGWSVIHAGLANHLACRQATREAGPRPTVSLVVATCNRPAGLRRCLLSLTKLKYAGSLEIIVVDNRPAQGIAAGVVAEFPGIRLVLEPRPGSSPARNAGVAAATGEIIAMTDDDMVVAPDWLDRLVEHFRLSPVLAVTGNTLPAELETQAERDFEVYGGFCRGFERKAFDEAWFCRGLRQAAPTWHIGGSGNAAFRASIFTDPAIGTFMETLGAGVPAGVGEDTMLFYQILRRGGTIMYEPSAIAWHHHRVTHAELKKQVFAYSKGHVAYHLITWMKYGDRRGLHRVLVDLPRTYLKRSGLRLLGKSTYPWRLLGTEMLGILLGPWALWRSHQHVRKMGAGPQAASPVAAGEAKLASPPRPLDAIR